MTTIICIFFLAFMAMLLLTLLYVNDNIRRKEIRALELRLWKQASEMIVLNTNDIKLPKSRIFDTPELAIEEQ